MGDSHWADSCAIVGELIASCSDAKPCAEAVGDCCFPAATSGDYSGAPVVSRVSLSAPAASAELSLDFELVTFSVLGQAQAIAYAGIIDGVAFRIAVRADLAESGVAFGPGVSFSGHIGSEDVANVEYDTPVFFDSSPDDGGSVRLNRPISFVPRMTLALRLSREEASGNADWFAVYVTIDGSAEELLGRVLFQRDGAGQAQIDQAGNVLSGLVLRDGEFALPDVGKVQVAATVPLFDGDPATAATLSYPDVQPSAMPFPNVDVSYEPAAGRLIVSQGGVTPKCTEAGELF